MGVLARGHGHVGFAVPMPQDVSPTVAITGFGTVLDTSLLLRPTINVRQIQTVSQGNLLVVRRR